MSLRPPTNALVHAVLTSDIVNEAEQTFRSMCPKDGPFLISQIDCLTLLRTMGLNPTDADLNILFDRMKIRDPEREKRERAERDEFLKKEAERKAKEKAERELMKDDKKAKAAASDKKKKKEEGKDPMLWIPFERRPVIDWRMFIENVEPYFTDSKIEQEAIVRALKVFDREGKGSISREDLIRLLTTKGEDILAPLEVAALIEAFPQSKVDFVEFAARIQGTYVEPPKEDKPPGTAPPVSARSLSTSGTAGAAPPTTPPTGTPAPAAAAAAPTPASGDPAAQPPPPAASPPPPPPPA